MPSDDTEDHPHQNSHEIGKDDHHRSVSYRFAEFVLYSIFVAGDVHTFWENHRLLALIIALAGLGCLLIIDRGFRPKTIIRVLIGASLIAIAFYFFIPKLISPDIEMTGTVYPGSGPDLSNNCPASDSPEAWKVFVGNTAFQFADPMEIKVLEIGSCSVLTVKKSNEQLSVAADLYDLNGRLLATIKNNEFHAMSGEAAHISRDHDLSKLIVTNGEGQEILFVHFINKSSVRIRGVFGCPGYQPIPIKDGQPIPNVNTLPGVCMNALKGAKIGGLFKIR